jgi:SAM-dependent methyltransferase
MFEVAEAYERQRGRSSKLLAPLFTDFVGLGVHGAVLDIGCGTGALTFVIAKNQVVSKIIGCDLSEAFLEYARSKTDDPRISFEQGDAHKLPFPDASFDCCLALLAHPRFHLHFVPTSSSWLNLVERWFRDLTDKRVRRGVFRSVNDLIAAIEAYIHHHNSNPKPFIWTAKAEDIIAKYRRAKAVLDNVQTA